MADLSFDDRRRYFAEEIEAVAHLDAPALVDAFARDPTHEPILRRLLAPGVTITAIDPMPHEPGPDCLAHIDGFCVQ